MLDIGNRIEDKVSEGILQKDVVRVEIITKRVFFYAYN